MNLIDIANMSEDDCIKFFEKLRWPNGVTSPFDHSSNVTVVKGKYYCCKTKKYFNVKTKSIYHSSKVSLKKWLIASYLFTENKKGVSSYSLSKQIGVTQKTAWKMLHKLRPHSDEPVGGEEAIVEVDETFVGGKNKNRHVKKRFKYEKGRNFPDKTPVIGALDRQGRLVTKVLKSVKHKDTVPAIISMVKYGSTLVTDEFHKGSYKLQENFRHAVLNHSAYEYVNGIYHSNSIEGFWSQLKRGINGIYHHVSRKYLQNYCDEFAFRYNVRNLSSEEKMETLIKMLLWET